MSGFQKEVRTTPRSQSEINAERNDGLRSEGVRAFVSATNAPDGGAYGYQKMLEHLFDLFESDHGPVATIDTVLDALKPVLRNHYDLDRLRTRIDQILDEVEATK